MKIRLLGNQKILLDDTCYWTQANKIPLPEPINSVIDWSESHLLDLAKYCEDRADLVTYDATTKDLSSYRSSHAEANSLLALAKRIRKTVAQPSPKK